MVDPSRLGISNVLLHACPDAEQPAVRQVERMGFDPADVRDIICTHLDRDHAGGLADFPSARVHVSEAEVAAAIHPRGFRARDCYRQCHFAHGPAWETYRGTDGEWFGFEKKRLSGLPEEVFLVRLPGHTPGHCGVAVDIGESWLLHCGDTYYVSGELEEGAGVPAGVRGFRRVAHEDHPEAMRTLERVKRMLKEDGGRITTISAHDMAACRSLRGKSLP
jgi:glyoxylase-like metal-dependent hydrolase (beta-lactamase superfamily II)